MAVGTSEINPRLIENEQFKQLFNLQDTTAFDPQSFILDREWAKQAFLINDAKLENTYDVKNRYWSSASAKFTDSRIGGNLGINSRPQFTRYADIRVKGRLQGRNETTVGNTSGNLGMGRYYSEAIDDPAQTIYMRFGVPQFNGIVNFLSQAFDPSMVSLAKTGRDPGVLYNIGKVAGTVASFVAFPAIAITIYAGKFISSFFTRPTSKYYTLKPTMHLYWNTVEQLVNALAVNRGLLPKVLNSEEQQKVGNTFKLDQAHLSEMHNLFPDFIGPQNHINVYGIANRAQRLANKLFAQDYAKLENGTSTDYTGLVQTNTDGGDHPTAISNEDNEPTLSAMLNNVLMFGYYKTSEDEVTAERLELDPRIDPSDPKAQQRTDPSFFQEIVQSYDAEVRDGSQYAVFKVDHTGSVSEAFGNSVGESDLSRKLNEVSSTARQARFTFSDGNLLEGTMLSGVGAVIGGVTSLAEGLLDGVTFGMYGAVKNFLGAGYVDIPKYWQSSSATLPRSNYTMTLISPYGNVISHVQNIYIPLCMLLAGALPLSTGKQSYTSPFLCQIFDRGRAQCRLGMIESLSLTRGTSNLPYDLKGNALAIDVSFSVVDLSSIMHMPVSTGSLNPLGIIADAAGLGAKNMTLDEDNILMDYLAVLAGQDMYTQVYPMTKAKLNLAKRIMSTQKLTSPAYWAAFLHDSAESGLLSYMGAGVIQGAIEGSVRGSAIVSNNQ